MEDPSGPSGPLKILTLDGGGLQAISTLLILNNVLETIAKQNGVPEHKKPRPCDVFDTIAGIGAGGWLAILLGRFRMDIVSCLTEWYTLTQCIAPKTKTEELRLRLLQHCYFDTERLVEQAERLTELYGTGDCLFETDTKGARTRHVFVAALASDGERYNLFRSYEIPKSAKLPKKLLEGPENPSSFKIASAFGVTGAARYFTNPWKENMASSGKIKFSDTKFPKPHNITELALDEMWGIYGTDIPLSVVVNIGPGLPSDADVKRIARRFSWGLDPGLAHGATPAKRANSPIVTHLKSEKVGQDAKRASIRFHEDKTNLISTMEPATGDQRNRSVIRTNTFGSIRNRGVGAKLKRLEGEIESDIKGKLDNIHKGSAELYYRLAPAKAPQGTYQNDSSASGVALDATMAWLSEPRVGAKIDELVKKIPKAVSNR